MSGKLVFVLQLAALLCVGGFLTAKSDEQLKTRRFETIIENFGSLGEDIQAIGSEIDKLEYEIEDVGEGIEDMETALETVKAEVVNLREEANTTIRVLQTGQYDIGQKMTQLVEEATINGNYTQCLKQDTQTIKDELTSIETAVDELRNGLDTKVKGLEGHHLQEFEYLKTSVEQQDALTTKTESLEDKLVGLKHYTIALANHTETDLEDIKGELIELSMNQTNNYREVKEELTSLQRDMNSTLHILQELKNQLITMRQENLIQHQTILDLPGSCSELHPTSPSGYYWLRGLSEKVYCDMDRQSCGCGSPWGWMRVANIDMTDPNQQCPEGFTLRPGTSTRMCEMTSYSPVCTPIVFPTHSVQYNKVCGRVKAYQYYTPEAFNSYWIRSHTIDDQYVDGVSITHGRSPRKHIWTFAAAVDETRSNRFTCPCTKTDTIYTGLVPPFIGNDYFCDTGSSQGFQPRLYTEDPLWDGEGCGPTSSCCQFNSPPWFCKELPQPTTDDIEVRICRDHSRSSEEIPFEQIELYVK